MASSSENPVIKSLSAAGVSEDHFQWYGFLLALIAKGFKPGDQALSKMVADLLNGGGALPGKMVAYLTSEGLALVDRLVKRDPEILSFPGSEESKELRLRCLADLASGLSLGFGCDPKEGVLRQLPKGDLTDFVQSLGEIARVDPEDELLEDDLAAVLEYMRDTLFSLARQG